MRRSPLTIFTTVSVLALVAAATTTQAISPPALNLGLLKPRDQWKVGAVNTQAASYCAMVNKFEKGAILAFALNPQGFGTVAIDFRDRFFEPGTEYEVVLRPSSTEPRKLTGRASSDQSIVVQIGQNSDFFDELRGNSDLGISLPAIEVTFALRQFSSSYNNLMDCTYSLADKPARAAAAPQPDAGAEDLSAIDREVALLDQERARISSADKEAEGIRARIKSSAESYDKIEAKLEQETASEQVQAAGNMQAIAAHQDDLMREMAEKQAEIAKMEGLQKTAAARDAELPSSIGATSLSGAAAVTGIVAQKMNLIEDGFLTQDTLPAAVAVAEDAPVTLIAPAGIEDKSLAAERLYQQTKAMALEAERSRQAAQIAAEAAAKSAYASSATEIADKKKQIETLERKLADAEAARVLEASRAAAAQKELEESRAQLASLKKNVSTDQARLTELQASLTLQKAALEKQAATLAAEASRIEKEGQNLASLRQNASSGEAKLADLKAQLDLRSLEQEQKAEQLKAEEARIALMKADVSAGQLMASEKAELAESRLRISQLEEKLKQSQQRITQLETSPAHTGNVVDKEAKASLERRALELDQKEKALAEKERQASAPLFGIFSGGKTQELADTKAEIAKLKADHAKLSASAPAAVASLEPAAGTVNTADNFAVPAVPSTPVTQEKIEQPAPKVAVAAPVAAPAPVRAQAYSNSRAAAFLNKVMSYHRPTGARAIGVVSTAPAAPAAPVTPPSAEETAQTLRDTLALSGIETAAGTPVRSFAAPTLPTPSPANIGGPVTLETLLSRSGIEIKSIAADVASPQDLIRWRSGRINGMYEHVSTAGVNFPSEMQEYLDRYREDCPQQLQVNAGNPRSVEAGSIALTEIACTMPGNSYNSSFVFLQDSRGFHAVLHTGLPPEAAAVSKLGHGIVSTLEVASAFVASPVASAQNTVGVGGTGATGQLKFNISDTPLTTAPAAAVSAEPWETIVVQ